MPTDLNDVLRCAVRQKGVDNQDIVNVYEFECQLAGPWSDAAVLAGIASYFDTAYNDIETTIPTAQSPYDIKVDKVDVVGGKKEIVGNIGTTSWGTLYNPSGAGADYAPGVAALILLRTLVGKIFGRKFIGLLQEPDVDGTALTSTLIANLANMAAKLLLGVTVASNPDVLVPGILSTNVNHMGEFHEFVQGEVSSEPAYQRRRKISIGT